MIHFHSFHNHAIVFIAWPHAEGREQTVVEHFLCEHNPSSKTIVAAAVKTYF